MSNIQNLQYQKSPTMSTMGCKIVFQNWTFRQMFLFKNYYNFRRELDLVANPYHISETGDYHTYICYVCKILKGVYRICR